MPNLDFLGSDYKTILFSDQVKETKMLSCFHLVNASCDYPVPYYYYT